MTYHKPLHLKNLGLWLLLICCGLMTAFAIFIGMISIWVGLKHLGQDGFWMPVGSGTLLVIFILWLFFRLSRFTRQRTKEKDILDRF